MIRFVESSDIFEVFNTEGEIIDSRVSNDDLVFVPQQPTTNDTFKGHNVSGKSILVTRGNAYQLVDLDKLEAMEDLIYAGL